MENIPVTETGKEMIARDVSGLNLVYRERVQKPSSIFDIVGEEILEEAGCVKYHKPNYGSESEIYPDSESESDKCLDSDVCPRVDVEESWKTGTEMIARHLLRCVVVSHTEDCEEQEWNTAQDTHLTRHEDTRMLAAAKSSSIIYRKRNYGSESDKCSDSDVCPRVDIGESWKTGLFDCHQNIQMEYQAAGVIHHKPNYGSESEIYPDSESDSDKCPDSDVCPRVDIGESWKTGLFDCHKNKTIAAVVTFCPCVAFGQIAEVLHEGEMTCSMGSFIYLLTMPLLCSQRIIGSEYRKKLIRKLNLVEDPCEDWAFHMFCHYCSLCQEYRELQIRGLDPSLGWKGILARQQGMQKRSQDLVQCPPRTQAMSK